jgi:ABC-type multidrug transport system permease subunit
MRFIHFPLCPWLQGLAKIDPLTHLVDTLRRFMIKGGQSAYGFQVDFVVMGLNFVVLFAMASKLYPALIRSVDYPGSDQLISQFVIFRFTF